jgi:prephenate dehydrogenase
LWSRQSHSFGRNHCSCGSLCAVLRWRCSLAYQTQAMDNCRDTRAVIIGSAGTMGRHYTQLLRAGGWQCTGVDTCRSSFTNEQTDAVSFSATNHGRETLLHAHVVLVAVPMPHVTSVLEAILPACEKGSTVIEVCSLKAHVLPFHEIALDLGVELLSLHPMFSPTSGRPPGITLLLNEPRFMGSEHFLSTATRQGETFLRWPLETHDKCMATIQVATYLSSLAFGEFLRTQNWNGKENSALHTLLFSQTLEILRRVSGPDPHYQERCHPSQSQTRGLDGAEQCVVTARRSRLMSEGG